ncbi:hypothetical protein A3Q56_02974 [Intoshia linei]|uniref:Fork-head domain-containing protein n=1 Tax=Intoshia linei TaxID=1819745 RepID=A0A177B4U8_9BILA|nr:hypothetical protein A3Q56_02974 [Intoshia linei]
MNFQDNRTSQPINNKRKHPNENNGNDENGNEAESFQYVTNQKTEEKNKEKENEMEMEMEMEKVKVQVKQLKNDINNKNEEDKDVNIKIKSITNLIKKNIDKNTLKPMERPEISITQLIYLSLLIRGKVYIFNNYSTQGLQMKKIFEWVDNHYAYFRSDYQKMRVRNSIRHTLSVNPIFISFKPKVDPLFKGSSVWVYDSLATLPIIPNKELLRFRLNHLVIGSPYLNRNIDKDGLRRLSENVIKCGNNRDSPKKEGNLFKITKFAISKPNIIKEKIETKYYKNVKSPNESKTDEKSNEISNNVARIQTKPIENKQENLVNVSIEHVDFTDIEKLENDYNKYIKISMEPVKSKECKNSMQIENEKSKFVKISIEHVNSEKCNDLKKPQSNKNNQTTLEQHRNNGKEIGMIKNENENEYVHNNRCINSNKPYDDTNNKINDMKMKCAIKFAQYANSTDGVNNEIMPSTSEIPSVATSISMQDMEKNQTTQTKQTFPQKISINCPINKDIVIYCTSEFLKSKDNSNSIEYKDADYIFIKNKDETENKIEHKCTCHGNIKKFLISLFIGKKCDRTLLNILLYRT